MHLETKAIHVGEEPDFKEGKSGDVVVPLHLSSTFARPAVDAPPQGYDYARTGNPTRHALELKLAALENARYALAFSSGMAAITTLGLTLLHPHDHVLAFDDLYGGTRRVFDTVFARNFEVDVAYVDARELANVERALKPATRLIWLETPTNPLLKICDIAAISRLAHERGITLAVDNTFATPCFQRPLELGADIVAHSTTKYLNGHSDSVGGALVLSDDSLYERLKFNQNAAGAILSPFDSYLVLRGLKTLSLRMRAHAENARRIADYLAGHPKVASVLYPGLHCHPQHELAQRQMSGFAGMVSFELKGQLAQARRFVESTRLFALAESLGCVESLIELPALMTHATIAQAEREKIGIPDALIRVSVGIEHVEDLIADLDQAFSKI